MKRCMWFGWIVLMAATGPATGCFNRHYTIRGPEARRAIQTLQGQDEAVVAATNQRTRERVHILLRSDDYLEVLPGYAGGPAAGLATRGSDGPPIQELTLRQANAGPLLMIIGGGVVGAGYLLGLMSAQTDHRTLVPLYGAPAAVFDSPACQNPEDDCGWRAVALIPAMLSIVVQGIGLATLTAGAITYRPSPEVPVYDDEPAFVSGLNFGLVPLGERGAVGALGFRF